MDFLSKIPRPNFTRLENKNIFIWMNKNAPNKKVLNLGSGVRKFDDLLSDDIISINLDIEIEKPAINIQADAHQLPFKDNCFDIIYSIAVLEHVKKPWIVADEITRILKPGGHILVDLPFMNIIHAEHDYFRFTDKGISSLFDENRYIIVDSGISAGGGSFLSVFLLYYFRQFIPSSFLKFLWLAILYFPASLLKYIDLLPSDISNSRITANSFYFIGQKL